jgi:hypothetical protein
MAMAKKTAKKATAKQQGKKGGCRKAQSKVDDAAVKKYREKYEAWEAIARKVLTGSKGVKEEAARKVQAAKDLMEKAGGYEEAFVILDAVMIAATTKEDDQLLG